MKRIRYHEAAQDEFLREVQYYADITGRLGERFDKAVQAAEARAAEAPEAGSPYLHGTRRVLLQRFPFSLIYTVGDAEIVIVAVAPFRRRPGYWKHRA